MKLVIVHYHLRPGGIRRIIELAVPHLVRAAPRPITGVVLATGRRADRSWHKEFARRLPGVNVEVLVEPAFNYLSEQRGSPANITAHLRRALENLFAGCDPENCLVWTHNPGVGRNLLLARELAAACAERNLPLVAHHHDWWFDNRWARWPEMRRYGFRTLAAPARVVFPPSGKVLHAAINQADAAIFARHFGKRAQWLPNLTEPTPPPPAARLRATRHWLRNKLEDDGAPACVAAAPQDHCQNHIRLKDGTPADDPTSAQRRPVWLLPCRTLRRKNIAEALLLTRWLRPEAWLVVTGAASSADEAPYFRALEQAAHEHHWRLRLGVLAGDEARQPTVPELLAASEVVLLTSIQEGFGLPYLEAAAAHRPLIARRLPNIAPDLDRFGFRFPQAYDEILIAPGLFDWKAERGRQRKCFDGWRAAMPASVRTQVGPPPLLTVHHPAAVPFSRLTLAAQLEVLAHPARETWEACRPLNPFLETWRQRAAAGKLRVTPWPQTAKRWLGGAAYAQGFFAALEPKADSPPPAFSPLKVQADFIAAKLDARNLYPLLWSRNS